MHHRLACIAMPFSLNGPAPHAEHTNDLSAGFWFGSLRLPGAPSAGDEAGARRAVILAVVSLVDLSGSATAVGTMFRVRGGLTRGEGAPPADVHSHALGVEGPVVARAAVEDLLAGGLLLLVGDLLGFVRPEAREADARGRHLHERRVPRAARVDGVARLPHRRPILEALSLGLVHNLREQQPVRSSLLEHLEAYPLDRAHADALLDLLERLDRRRVVRTRPLVAGRVGG